MRRDTIYQSDLPSSQRPTSKPSQSIAMQSSGALSLLNGCVQLEAGHKLAIVEESGDIEFYDKAAPALTAETARLMGATVDRIEVPKDLSPDQIISVDANCSFLASLKHYDRIIFFSRLGDQIRFCDNSSLPPTTMCYTLGEAMLNSSFGTACHHGMCEIKQAIDKALTDAESIKVTCPLGTDYRGSITQNTTPMSDVSIKRFPMLVPTPIDSREFSGTVVLNRFLVGTGSRYYDPYCLPLSSPVTAQVNGNAVTDFTGDAAVVKSVKQHYQNVASRFGIDTWHVHSWHAGIHPGCRFDDDALTNIMRWSSSAFGNPRLLHFHTCGNYAPGEISWNIVDPTITVDGVKLWDHGKLRPERIPTCKALLEEHPNLAHHFNNPQTNIGLS